MASFVLWVGTFTYTILGTGTFRTDAIVPINSGGADLCAAEGSRRELAPGGFQCEGCTGLHHEWQIEKLDWNPTVSDISAPVEGRLIIKPNEGEGDPDWDEYIVTDEGGNLHNGCMRLERNQDDYEICASAGGLDVLDVVPHLTCYVRDYEGWTSGVVFG